MSSKVLFGRAIEVVSSIFNIRIKLFFGEVEFLFKEIEIKFEGILIKLFEFNLEVELKLKMLLFI